MEWRAPWPDEVRSACAAARELARVCAFLQVHDHLEPSDMSESTRLDILEAKGWRDELLDIIRGEGLHVTDHDPDTDPYLWE